MEKRNYETQIAYIHGRIEAQLDAFAHSLNLPAAELAYRVGALLLAAQGGESLGPNHNLSFVRNATAQRHQAVEPLALAGSTHSKASHGPKTYWSKMTKLQRSREMKRRMAKRQEKTP